MYMGGGNLLELVHIFIIFLGKSLNSPIFYNCFGVECSFSRGILVSCR
jgi:hypothetical protein